MREILFWCCFRDSLISSSQKGKLNFRRKEIFSLFKQSKKISNSLETEITSKLYFRSGPIKKVYFKYSFWMGYKVENERVWNYFFERNLKDLWRRKITLTSAISFLFHVFSSTFWQGKMCQINYWYVSCLKGYPTTVH